MRSKMRGLQPGVRVFPAGGELEQREEGGVSRPEKFPGRRRSGCDGVAADAF